MGIRRSSGVAVLVVVVVGLGLIASAFARGARIGKVDPAFTRLIEAQFAGWAEVTRTRTQPASSVYAAHAMVAMTGTDVSPQVTRLTELESKWTVFGPSTITRHKVRDVRVGVSRDGRAAWLSFFARVGVDGLGGNETWELRASQLLFKSAAGWEVGSGAWSLGQKDRALAKAIEAQILPQLEPIMNDNVGARDVLSALDQFITSGFAGTAAARTDVVAIGTSPGDIAIGGKAVVASYQRMWAGKAQRDGAAWAVTAPSGTTACVTANVQLVRGKGDATYEVPARLFVVFDKDAEGAWTPVHAHLGAPAPAP